MALLRVTRTHQAVPPVGASIDPHAVAVRQFLLTVGDPVPETVTDLTELQSLVEQLLGGGSNSMGV